MLKIKCGVIDSIGEIIGVTKKGARGVLGPPIRSKMGPIRSKIWGKRTKIGLFSSVEKTSINPNRVGLLDVA